MGNDNIFGPRFRPRQPMLFPPTVSLKSTLKTIKTFICFASKSSMGLACIFDSNNNEAFVTFLGKIEIFYNVTSSVVLALSGTMTILSGIYRVGMRRLRPFLR